MIKSKNIEYEDLIKFCKRNAYDLSIFDGYEYLANETVKHQKIKGSSKKQVSNFREVLGWYITEDLRKIALMDIADGNLILITKSSAIKKYSASERKNYTIFYLFSIILNVHKYMINK